MCGGLPTALASTDPRHAFLPPGRSRTPAGLPVDPATWNAMKTSEGELIEDRALALQCLQEARMAQAGAGAAAAAGAAGAAGDPK